MRGTTGTGLSEVGDAFGAQVSIAIEGRSLFFVAGRTGPPDAIVRAAGGVVVTRLPDRRKVLAVADLKVYPTLIRHPEVAIAGPVAVDPERFTNFARLVGLDNDPAETTRPP